MSATERRIASLKISFDVSIPAAREAVRRSARRAPRIERRKVLAPTGAAGSHGAPAPAWMKTILASPASSTTSNVDRSASRTSDAGSKRMLVVRSLPSSPRYPQVTPPLSIRAGRTSPRRARTVPRTSKMSAKSASNRISRRNAARRLPKLRMRSRS
jgi:hypothetical protein